ncbi:MAG TPA: BamA/TamA family outer membrane protein, partial [Candidatus Udaeobacter sp.]|nr:BamA/TamA family outer membrane protein [Candidatus Udaeobacter sp.]
FDEPPDLAIKPELGEFGGNDYQDFRTIVARGREAAAPALAANRAQLPSAPARPAPDSGPTRIALTEITVEGNQAVREELIRKTFGAHPAEEPIDLDRVLRGMDALHATRLFDSIWVDLDSEDEEHTQAKIQVQETWPWALEGGLSYVEADQFGGFVRVRNRNLWGFGENAAITGAASDSELRASIQLASQRLFTPAIGYYARAWLWEDKPRVFVAHEPAGRFDFDRLGAAAGVQRALGPEVLLRAGVGIERIETDSRDEPVVPSGRERIFDVSGLVAWDRLDNPSFPAAGFATGISGVWGQVDDLAQDRTADYWRVAASARAARSFGRRTVLDGIALAGVAGGEVPLHELFRIGGPIVPGLYRDELWDRQAAAVGIACRILLWKSLHATALGGVGEAWPDWDAATLDGLHRGFGIGLESPTRIGPLSLIWGRGDDGESRIYFTAGYRFYPALWLPN